MEDTSLNQNDNKNRTESKEQNSQSAIVLNKPANAAQQASTGKRKINYLYLSEIANIIISTFLIGLFVYSTYNVQSMSDNSSFLVAMIIANIYFILHFLLQAFYKNSMHKVTYFTMVVEFFSTFLFFVLMLFANFQIDYKNMVYVLATSTCSIRTFRFNFLTRFIESDVNKKLYDIVVLVAALLLISTAIINIFENFVSVGSNNLFEERDRDPCEDCEPVNQSYHNTFFFILTLIAIIGYESQIVSAVGRVLIIALIVVSLMIIPQASSEFMNLIANKSIYARHTYKRNANVDYILITGNISINSMIDLLREYFHLDHGESERHALILMPKQPDSNIKKLLQDYPNKLIYFEGDPLKESELKRCQFKYAKSILILCNKQTDDSHAEDSKTILQAMAIRNLLSSSSNSIITKKQKEPEAKMLIQLLRPESELHYSLSINKKSNLDQILCIDELKLSLLSKSCLCPGIIAMISNLITTSNLEGLSEKVFEDEENSWLREYKEGKGLEIYKINLDNARGMKFIDIADKVYKAKEVILFGVNVSK